MYYTIPQATPMMQMGPGARSPFEVDRALRNPRLCAAFGIGFGILFVFIGAFTYVNFVLLRPPVFARPNGCWASLLPGRLDHAKVGSQKLSFHLGDSALASGENHALESGGNARSVGVLY